MLLFVPGLCTSALQTDSAMRIPRVLNLWSTHQFWIGFFGALGIDARRLEFSSDSSEDQARQLAKGRGTVDCCYPVKCINGHYGELLARDGRHKIDMLFSPMSGHPRTAPIPTRSYGLPSSRRGCTRRGSVSLV